VIEEFDELVRKANGVPFTDQVRLDRREIDGLLERLRTALSNGPSAVAALLDQLDELVQRAKPVPRTNQVRIERLEIYDVLDRMRATLWESADRTAPSHGPSEVTAALDALDELVRRAKPIPLTTQVRIDRIEIYELLDRIRATLGRSRDEGRVA
jgi:hypothetical protein